MERKEILEKTLDSVESVVGKPIRKLVKEETSYKEDLGLDSLDLVELVMELEGTFGITVSDEETEKLTTIKETVDFIFNKTQQSKG